MMPKEKSKELLSKFLKYTWNGEDNLDNQNAKELALISINETLQAISEYENTTTAHKPIFDYWMDVKKELLKL
jgi:hypothetical protein